MVEQMKKYFKSILCLLMAVLLPLSFSACKSSKKDQSNDDEKTPSPPEPAYILTDEEINRILTLSYDSCETFIKNLNDSNVLKDNNYGETEGLMTDSVFDYIFYPAEFIKKLNVAVESSKTYAYQNTTKEFFKVAPSENNDSINVFILVDKYSNGVTSYNYEFGVNNGNLESIKLSYYDADSHNFNFSETFIDLKNSECDFGFGGISDIASPKNIIENHFSKESIENVDPTFWTLSYYQVFKFGNQKLCRKNNASMPNNTDLVNLSDRFGFVDTYKKLTQFNSMQNSELTGLENDYFAQLFAYGHISFDSESAVFEIKTEE